VRRMLIAVIVLVAGVVLWLGFGAPRPLPEEQPQDSPITWQQIYAHPVRSLAVAGNDIVLGTYQDSVVLHPDGTTARIPAEPASTDSIWAGTVFALAVDRKDHKVYEGRDQAYEVGLLDLNEGKWQALPGFGDSERWTVWSLAVEDALYAGTGKGVWMHSLQPETGKWKLLGPPGTRARLPVFSLLHTERGLYAGTFDGVWLYSNGEWQFLTDAPRGKVLALGELYWKGHRYLAAGTGDGLYLQQGTEPWRRVGGDYSNDPAVYSVAFDPQSGALFAGTANGVARLDLSADESPMRWEKIGLSGPIMALAWHDSALLAGGDSGAFVWKDEGR